MQIDFFSIALFEEALCRNSPPTVVGEWPHMHIGGPNAVPKVTEIHANLFSLPPSRLALTSLGCPYELLGSPSGFISITAASLSVGFDFPWVPLCAARVALRFYFDRLCLPFGWL